MYPLQQKFVVLTTGLITLIAGCGYRNGPTLGTVTGLVTLNGKPLKAVNVVFTPKEKGSPSYGGTDNNGRYYMKFNSTRSGVQVGSHSVQIENRTIETDDSGNPLTPVNSIPVPEKYTQPGALSAEVFPGTNELDFELTGQ